MTSKFWAVVFIGAFAGSWKVMWPIAKKLQSKVAQSYVNKPEFDSLDLELAISFVICLALQLAIWGPIFAIIDLVFEPDW